MSRLSKALVALALGGLVFAAALPAAADSDLATVDLPSRLPPTAVAVIYSGDGGWQDLDRTIGEWMAGEDIHVIGVSTLDTFWESREPQTVAADLEGMLAKADPGGALPVLVVGYSFGADVFPFAWPFLRPATRDRIKLIALLAPERTTAFHVSVTGWVGMETGDHEVVPAASGLPRDRVLCAYGSEEAEETPCVDPALNGVETVETSGGHHFDGDYVALGRTILDAFRRRL